MEDDQQFKTMVRYFYEEKGDPTRYSSWDAERCKRLMPDFFYAWQQAQIYERFADDAIRREVTDYP